MFYTFLILCLFGHTLAQISELGECPDMKPIPNFDMDKFLGKWNTVEMYRELPGENWKCYNYNFSRDENGTNYYIDDWINERNNIRTSILTTLDTPNPAEPGKFHMKLWNSMLPTIECIILDTDYVSYGIFYACNNGTFKNHYTNVHILTRDQNPSESVVAKYVESTEKYNFVRKNFVKMQQDDCELRPSK